MEFYKNVKTGIIRSAVKVTFSIGNMTYGRFTYNSNAKIVIDKLFGKEIKVKSYGDWLIVNPDDFDVLSSKEFNSQYEFCYSAQFSCYIHTTEKYPVIAMKVQDEFIGNDISGVLFRKLEDPTKIGVTCEPLNKSYDLECYDGDWLVIRKNSIAEIYTDVEFRKQFH